MQSTIVKWIVGRCYRQWFTLCRQQLAGQQRCRLFKIFLSIVNIMVNIFNNMRERQWSIFLDPLYPRHCPCVEYILERNRRGKPGLHNPQTANHPDSDLPAGRRVSVLDLLLKNVTDEHLY
ncbi:hypothetical protein NQ318_003344 [Aromia moschata]|uniref:Uncharacterized protein n=1 Tax=Aromia moschata TaxID=1265417 RepID=A0AAV8XHJ6_9CUCU|nr:hypothetical protein NQ318_003344 [Aromia moschata]